MSIQTRLVYFKVHWGGLPTLGEAILRTSRTPGMSLMLAASISFRAIIILPYFTLPHIRNLRNSTMQTPLVYFKVHWEGLPTLGEAILRTSRTPGMSLMLAASISFRAIVILPYFTLPHIRNLNNSTLQTPLVYFKIHWGAPHPWRSDT